MKFDAYQMVTDRICALLQQGIKPWAKPWNSVMDCAWSGQTGRPYSLLNQMLLADPEKKYTSLQEWADDIRGEWLSFNQIKDRGGNVQKGQHGRKIVFFKMLPIKNDKIVQDEQDADKHVPFLSVTTVFHIRQCDGISQKYHLQDQKTFDFVQHKGAEQLAEEYMARTGVTLIIEKGNKAFYRPATDQVHIPTPQQFPHMEEYYSTLFHEFTHSTGHPSRLNRVNGNTHFGDESYSLEELVAEIGSASILATLGMETSDSITNSAAYIANWLQALQNDKTMIVKAASRAEKAVQYILDIHQADQQPQPLIA